MESIKIDIPSNDVEDDSDDDSFYVANCNLTARRAKTDFYKVVQRAGVAAPIPNGQPKVAEKYIKEEKITKKPSFIKEEKITKKPSFIKEEKITKKPSFLSKTGWDEQPNFYNEKSVLPTSRNFSRSKTHGGFRRKRPSFYQSNTVGPVIKPKPKPQLNRIKIKSRHNVIFKGTTKGHWDGKRNRGIGDDEELLKEPEVIVPEKRVRLKILSKSLFQRSRPHEYYTRGLLISLGLCFCFSTPIAIVVILLLGVRASYDGW